MEKLLYAGQNFLNTHTHIYNICVLIFYYSYSINNFNDDLSWFTYTIICSLINCKGGPFSWKITRKGFFIIIIHCSGLLVRSYFISTPTPHPKKKNGKPKKFQFFHVSKVHCYHNGNASFICLNRIIEPKLVFSTTC